jgi:hypothetical protein
MQGGKPENVSKSFTPLIDERLTYIQPKRQWTDINWKKVEKHVIRLQTRITKAVITFLIGLRSLSKQKKQHCI